MTSVCTITGSRLENCFGLPCVAWFTMYTSMMSVWSYHGVLVASSISTEVTCRAGEKFFPTNSVQKIISDSLSELINCRELSFSSFPASSDRILSESDLIGRNEVTSGQVGVSIRASAHSTCTVEYRHFACPEALSENLWIICTHLIGIK